MTIAEKRRETILEAAGKCFRRKGFHLTSMQELCHEAEMSPGSVYRYFPSKDAIIEALVEEEKHYFFELFQRLDTQSDVVAGMIAMMDAFIAPDPGQVHLDAEITAEAFRHELIREILRRYEAEVTARLGALLTEGKQRGQIRSDVDLRSASLVLTCIADGLTYRRALGFLPDADAVKAAVGEMIRRLLCP